MRRFTLASVETAGAIRGASQRTGRRWVTCGMARARFRRGGARLTWRWFGAGSRLVGCSAFNAFDEAGTRHAGYVARLPHPSSTTSYSNPSCTNAGAIAAHSALVPP
jgi:hypothetical protein